VPIEVINSIEFNLNWNEKKQKQFEINLEKWDCISDDRQTVDLLKYSQIYCDKDCLLLYREREKWINKKSGQPCGVIHRGSQTLSQTKQKGWRRAEVVEPRKRLLGRQERGRALAQGQGDLLVRTVRGAPAAWGVGKGGGGGWARLEMYD